MIVAIAYVLTGLLLAMKLRRRNKLVQVLTVVAWPIVMVVLILMELAAIKEEK